VRSTCANFKMQLRILLCDTVWRRSLFYNRLAWTWRLFRLVRELRPIVGMKLWESYASATIRHRTSSRHEFVIGPLCDTSLSSRKGRLYYCRLCEWRFLVCGNKVAVLDENGKPLAGGESVSRFSTFENGPCPVFEAFASAAVTDVDQSRLTLRRKDDERSSLAPRIIPTRPDRPRSLLRVLTGLREDLGSRS
jgi:hypothetical protein